jgi:transcriptional regulator with XRE-family HTH domain
MSNLRLKQLRLARGLSLEELAAELGGIVTKQALSKYEQGKARPSPLVLNKLAAVLRVKAVYLWSEPTVKVEFVAYRKRSALPKREQEKVESLTIQMLEERVRLQSLTEQAGQVDLPIKRWAVQKLEDAECAAEELRRNWNLGLDPIASFVSVLEDHSIQVVEIDADDRFDGISAIASDEEGRRLGAAVVTQRGMPGERQRLNLAHELGHLILKVAAKVDEEKAAFRFGAALLAPAVAVLRETGTKRTLIQTAELLLLKRRFGLSMQALLFRLRELDVITESSYKQWCMDINRLGWRKREPGDLPPEQPQWLRQQVLHLLAEGLISREDAETAIGETVEADLPLSLIERRAFLKLPLKERRRIMAAQAEKVAPAYVQEAEWQEWQGGDIVDY